MALSPCFTKDSRALRRPVPHLSSQILFRRACRHWKKRGLTLQPCRPQQRKIRLRKIYLRCRRVVSAQLASARNISFQVGQLIMSGSGSGSSSSGHPFPRPSSRTGRARCQSTVGASDSPPAPSGRERLAINFLTSGGPPQPRFPPLQQGYTRVRSTSTADVSQARRHFVPTPSHLNPGQPRVATASGSAEDSGRTYHLEVIQHPETGAEFGSATLSRLPLSPPLIVQLTVRDRSGTPVRADAELPFLVAHLSLTTSDGATTLDFVNNPSARGGAALPQQLLYGTLVSSPHNYRTLQGAWGHHFLFPDVSVRRRGQYRLRIMLMRLDRLLPSGNPNTGEGVLAAALTNPFNILPHQNFVAPPPTALTQYLAQQGARMFTFASSPPSRQFIH